MGAAQHTELSGQLLPRSQWHVSFSLFSDLGALLEPVVLCCLGAARPLWPL